MKKIKTNFKDLYVFKGKTFCEEISSCRQHDKRYKDRPCQGICSL